MTQNAPLVETARAVASEKPDKLRKSDRAQIAAQAEPRSASEASAGAQATSDAERNAGVDGCEGKDERKAAREAMKAAEKSAEKSAEKAARKAQKAHEKTVAREARKAAEAEAHSENGKLRFESPVGRDEVAAYFEAIVEGLRKGSLQFRQGEQSLILSPPDRVEIGVKVERKNGREKLHFEIEWRTDEPEDLSILAG